MKIDNRKLDIILARQCKTLTNLKSTFDYRTLSRMRNDPNYRPTTKTIGKLAAALSVDVTEILTEGDAMHEKASQTQ